MDNKTSRPKLGDILKEEKNWIRKWYAQDEWGLDCSPMYSWACKFCLGGAMARMQGVTYNERLSKIVKDYCAENKKYKNYTLEDPVLGWNIFAFNDCPITTWDDIKEVVRRFDTQASIAGRLT